jgi:crotonobetainyl-CoA:carnitine CoA-transferase CaiB-like acyl-CoA transferase
MQLQGIKVIEFGANLAGPFCGQILSDLGAEVIKVERPSGDDCRLWGPPFVDGSSVNFVAINRGKKSAVVDLDDESQRQALIALIGEADVYLHNMRAGVMEKFGIDGKAMLKRFPRLIYADVSAFGHIGPMAKKPGYEPLLQAYSGLISMNGDPSGPAARIGASVIDYGTGMWTAIGVLAALVSRAQTGKGCIVNTSLFETALMWMSTHVAAYTASGKLPQRQGTGHQSLTPYQAFDTANGPLMVTPGNDRLWTRFCDVLGKPEWPADPRFVDNKSRASHRELLVGMIQDIMKGDTKENWAAKLDAAGVPGGPINRVDEVLASPQTDALGILDRSVDGKTAFTHVPVSFDGKRGASHGKAPRIGEQTRDILSLATPGRAAE